MIDKELYRQAYAEMQRWSEFAETERLQAAAQLTPEERWLQFQSLVAFSRNIQPAPSPYERTEKLAAVDRYYEAVRRLQEWRGQHGRPT